MKDILRVGFLPQVAEWRDFDQMSRREQRGHDDAEAMHHPQGESSIATGRA
jgi:hypothetical protein